MRKIEKYIRLIKEYSKDNCLKVTRQPQGRLKFPYLVPGANCYESQLWDWDSWLTDIGISQIMYDNDMDKSRYSECENGCIRNFAINTDSEGRMPILIKPDEIMPMFEADNVTNIHKPCFVQHMAFITKENGGDAEWAREYLPAAKKFLHYYFENFKHEKTGLFFWQDDFAIGVDNDPCTFFRPPKSSASVYLNCLMYKELKAMEYVLDCLGENSEIYKKATENLKNAVNEHMWDERNGFYYSVDLNLMPIESDKALHSGMPRHWDCVIERIDVWSGFMAMWAGISDRERAERMVYENMLDTRTFNAEYGVRTLSKLEKMYCIVESGNPSCWLGPIWGISNYICFRSLVKFGYTDEARKLVEKTVLMHGRAIEQSGAMYEYYHPDTGEGVSNRGFQSWNFLVNNMIAWYEGRRVIKEF